MQVVLVDLLMAVMDSLTVWMLAAGERETGLSWRDGVTARMRAAGAYVPYEELVAAEARTQQVPGDAPARLRHAWATMRPYPDAAALAGLRLPFAFLSNCSDELALLAAERSGLQPRLILSAEEVGWYKPHRRAYLSGCRRLGVPPAQTAFLAGSPYDAEGARRAGLDARLVLRRNDQPPPPGVPVGPSLGDLVTDL